MLKNAKHEAFARGIVAGKSATRAYLDAGYGGSPEAAAVSANRLLPKVAERIAELRAEIAARLDKATIRELNSRIQALDERWRLALKLALKSLKSGKPDVPLLREVREMEAWASKDLGQFEEKHHVSGSLIERLEAGRKRLKGGSEG